MDCDELDPVPVMLLTRRKKTPPGDRRSDRRRSSDDPVVLWRGQSRRPAAPSEGWTINVCAGGMRVIVDTALRVGEPVGIALGNEHAQPRQPGRVVWVSPRTDGCIAGIAYGWPTGVPGS